MGSTIEMKDMRYLNLFEKITRVSTRYCFNYNETIIFAVPRNLISKAIGKAGENVKKISEILGKKIKIIATPQEAREIEKDSTVIKGFIEAVVSPVTFRNLEVADNEIIITAGSHSKAALIGRNKRRLHELQKIAKDFFRKELKIV